MPQQVNVTKLALTEVTCLQTRLTDLLLFTLYGRRLKQPTAPAFKEMKFHINVNGSQLFPFLVTINVNIILMFCQCPWIDFFYFLDDTKQLSFFFPSPLNKLGRKSETRQSKGNCRRAVVWLSARECWKVFTSHHHHPSVPQLCITAEGRADALT